MDNLRSEHRLDTLLYLNVKQSDNNKVYGKLVDISNKGMRLMSNTPRIIGEKSNVYIQMPDSYHIDRFNDIHLECMWSRKSPIEGMIDSGFRIINSGENVNVEDILRYLSLPNYYNDFSDRNLLE